MGVLAVIAILVFKGGVVHAQNQGGPTDSPYSPAYNWAPAGTGWSYSAPQHLRYPPAAGWNSNAYVYDGSNASGDIEDLCNDTHPGAKKLLVPNMGAVFPTDGSQDGAYSYTTRSASLYVEYWATAYQCYNSTADDGSASLTNTSGMISVNGGFPQVAPGAFNGATDPDKGGNGGNWIGYGATLTLKPGVNTVCMKLSGTYTWTEGGATYNEPFGPLGFTDKNCVQVKYDRPASGGLYAWSCDLGDFQYIHRNNQTYTVKAGLLGSMQDPDYDWTQVAVYVNHVDPGNPNQQYKVGEYDASQYPLSLNGTVLGAGKPPYGTGVPNWHDWFVVPRDDLAQYTNDTKQHDVFVYGIGKDADGSRNGNNPEILHQPDGGRASIGPCIRSSVDPGDCTTGLHGWVTSDMTKGTNYKVHIYADGPAGGGGTFVKEYTASDAAYSPAESGVINGAHRFNVPANDLKGYADAYRHTFYVHIINGDNPVIGSTSIGPCTLPTCGSFTPSDDPAEVGKPFTSTASFNYAAENTARALNFDMFLSLNSIQVGSVNSHFSVEGGKNWDGSAMPPGAVRSNQVDGSAIAINTAGNYEASWQMQWVIPPDPNIVNPLFNLYKAAGGTSAYGANPVWPAGGGQVYGAYLASWGTWYGVIHCTSTEQVGNKPYVKVYGNDVSVGGKFADKTATTCSGGAPPPATPSGTAIWTFKKKTVSGANSYYGGSSTQFAALSMGSNLNFSSAGQRNPESPPPGAPGTPVGLSFGNMIDGSNLVADYGGNSDLWQCIPNYYSASSNPGADVRSGSIAARTIGATTISQGAQTAVFVNGDAYITGNITYANTAGGWTKVKDIPNFYLIVKGDIYIDHNVTALDGTYIAQPINTTQGGHIYTCTDTQARYSAASLYNGCPNKLTVTGSFIADKVIYQRTRGTVNNSIPDAPVTPSPITFRYSSAVNPGGNCMQLLETAPDSPSWTDNWLCTSRADFYWTNWPGISAAVGFKHNAADGCFNWAVQHNSSGFWGDNNICWPAGNPNPNLSWSATNDTTKNCILIYENSDPQWNPNSWLCAPIPPTPAYPTAPATTNEAPGSSNIAEVFNFSQESYLASVPSILNSVVGGGTSNRSYDAITSLPPIL